MERIAFLSQIKAGRIEEYDEAHRHVWPELICEMERFGVTECSIFLRGQRLFLYLRIADLVDLKQQLAECEVHQRWQQHMPLFAAVPGDLSDGYALPQEVFSMPGPTTADVAPE